MELLNQLGNWIAPRVCAECEGGSGIKVHPERDVAWTCGRCHGTGRSSEDGLQRLLVAQVMRPIRGRRRKPRSAA